MEQRQRGGLSAKITSSGEATLLIPRQQAKPNPAVKSRRETALIRL